MKHYNIGDTVLIRGQDEAVITSVELDLENRSFVYSTTVEIGVEHADILKASDATEESLNALFNDEEDEANADDPFAGREDEPAGDETFKLD